MAAVISGNGLGLFNTTLGGGAGGVGQGKDGQYVNVASGNLLLQSQDEQLVFRGLPVAQLRTYNSQGTLAQTGLDGWLTGFERRIELLSGTFNQAGSVMRRYTGDGAYQDFVFASTNTYVSTDGEGAHDTLVATAGLWTYTEGSSRYQEDYEQSALQGRLRTIRTFKSDGVTPTVWDVSYDAQGRISAVTANDGTGNGDALLFGYDATTGYLSTVSTREGGLVRGQVSYAYDSVGRLTSVTTDLTPDTTSDNDPSGNTDGRLFRTSYTYVDSSSLKIATVTQSDGTVVSYTYQADGKLKSVTQGDTNTNDADGVGETVTYTYGTNATTVTDSLGRAWNYEFDAQGRLTKVTAPAIDGLSDVTIYQYDSATGDLLQAKTTRGPSPVAQLDYKYDANGNVLEQWDLLGNAISRTYNADNQLLSETRYTNVDPDRTGPSLPTGGMTAHYAYDSRDRLRFVVDAAGDVTEYIYASSGNGIGQSSAQRRYTAGYYSGGFDEASLANWSAGQLTNSLMTEYGYDLWGRLQQTTAYATLDANGAGVLDAATDITRFVYDAQGLLRQQITVRGITRTLTGAAPTTSEVIDYAYDGMGRLLGVLKRSDSTSAAPNWGPNYGTSHSRPTAADIAAYAAANDATTIATTYTYLDSGHRLVVTQDSGATRTEARNAAGRLLSVADAGTVAGATVTRTTQNYYDSAGQLRASQDANGGRTYFFYDAKGRIEAVVDSTGAVTRTSYDGADHVIQVKQYANRVTTTSWLSGATVTKATFADIGVADASNDRIQSHTYDNAGRLATQTDAAGTVTTYSYDGASRLVQTRVYDPANAVPPRVTSYFYDNVGRLLATLDPEGYVVKTAYNAAGLVVAIRKYANVSPAPSGSGGLLAILPTPDFANDQTTWYYYDARGNKLAELDPEGYFTEWTYDEAGNTRAERRYLAQLTLDTLANLRTRAGTLYRESRRAYNVLGQLTTQTNPEGTVTCFSYDEAGRLVRTETAADTTEVRENFARYNVFGELIGELSGEGVEKAKTLLGSKLPTDPNLTETQLNQVYATYGVRHSVDALGRRIESIDALGNKTWMFYDSVGRPTFVVRGVADGNNVANALGEVTEIRYNAFGEVIDSIAYTGRVTLANPNDRPSVEAMVKALGYASASDSGRQFTYTTRGLLANVTNAEGMVTQYTYNAFGERSREVQAVGVSGVEVSTDYVYDRRGLLKTSTDEAGKSLQRGANQTYDAFGRVKTATDARGATTTFTYDRLGRQLTHSQTVQGRAETWITTYDAFDRVTSVMDPVNAALGAQGKATTYVYSTANRTVTVRTPEGVEVTTTHNRFGQTASVKQTLPDNTVVETIYTYDHDGNLVSTKDPLNQTSTNEYDVRGLLAATVDASGRRVELRYDAVGRVLQRIEDPDTATRTDELKLTTSYAYDGQGRQLTVTDPSGRVSTFTYDREGRLTQTVLDPGGVAATTTTYTYDAQGRQVTVTEGADTPAAQVTQYTYDVLGRRTQEVLDPGPGKLNLTTTYVYDANDNVVRRIDANSATTRFYYDVANRLVHTVDALGAMTRNWYDANGRVCATRRFVLPTNPATLTDSDTIAQLDGRLVWDNADEGEYRIYDGDGRLRFTRDAAARVREFQYDKAGRLVGTRAYVNGFGAESLVDKLFAGTVTPADITVTHDDTLDLQTWNVYDAAGRVRYTVDALGNTRQTFYDAAGRVVGTLAYANPIALDPAGSLDDDPMAVTRKRLSDGKVSLTALAGKVGAVDDENRDLRTYQVYDMAGRVRYTLDAYGALQEVSLDGAGRVTASRRYVKPVNLAALLAKLESGDKSAADDIKTQITAPGFADETRDLRTYRYYDGAGRLRAHIDGAGYLHATVYDAVSRVTLEKNYGQVTNNTVRDKLVAGTATLAEVFATTTSNDTVDQQTQYVYDAAGRLRYLLTRASASALAVTERLYDAAGRVTEERVYATVIAPSTTMTVDGVRTAITAANGDLSANQRLTRYVYDADGQLRFTIDNTGTVLEQRYDGLGRVLQSRRYGQIVSVANATEANVAAAVASIADVRITKTAYDAGGMVISVTDALNQTESYVYDALGQRARVTDKLGKVCTYGYDAAGRQVSQISPPVDVATVDAAGTVTVTPRSIVTMIGYDAFGNVISRTENANASDVNDRRTTQYVYDNRGHQIRTIFPDAGKLDPNIHESGNSLTPSGTTPSIQIDYDAHGRAVVQKDVRGNYSYKVYDALDRVVYEIDQEGYVTGYNYDGFGEQIGICRYANRINTGAIAGWQPGTAIREGDITAAVLADSGNDRLLTSSYDQRGRKTAVKQSAVDYYTGAGAPANGRPETRFTYNLYGELIQESVLLEGTPGQSSARWADTRHYYDAVGRETFTADAEGYVSGREYNARGEVVTQIEFARAVDTSTLSSEVPPALPIAGDANTGYDRVVLFTYDALGRKASERMRHAFQRTDGTTGLDYVVTTLGYDAADRVQTRTVNGATTTIVYDAIGRTISVTEPERDVLVGDADTKLNSIGNDLGSSALYERASPYTAMAYDAFGNVVRATRHANGVRNGAVAADATRDQETISRYDRQGRAVMTKTAEGHFFYSAYDAADNVVATWYKLADSNIYTTDAKVRSTFFYDKVGQQTSVTTTRNMDGAAGVVDQAEAVAYNSFGEVVQKSYPVIAAGDNSGLVGTISYTYDVAGRLISSNETGAPRNFRYNLAGHKVAEQRWSTLYNGTGATTTEVIYRQINDRLGRAVQNILPSHTANASTTSTLNRKLDRWGNVIEETDPRGYRTRTQYNEYNQAVRQISPQVEVVGEDGMVRWQTPETHWMYDIEGRLLATRDANGHVRQNVYDAAGQLVREADGTGAVKFHALDALGNARMDQDALGHITWKDYDRQSRLVAHGDFGATWTRSRITLESYRLNEHNDRVQVTTGLFVSSYDYNSASKLLQSRSASGVVRRYAYDVLGHKTLDANGFSSQVVADPGEDSVKLNELSWRYNAFGQITDHNDLSGADFDYENDATTGQLTGQKSTTGSSAADIPGGLEDNATDPMDRIDERKTYFYANGLVRRIEEKDGVWYAYEYDANGNRTLEETNTYDGRGWLVHVRTYTRYDSHNRVARVYSEELDSNGTVTAVQVDLRYGYDAVGNRRVVVANSGGYDSAGNAWVGPTAPNQAPVLIGTPESKSVKAGVGTLIQLRPLDIFQDPEQKQMTYTAKLASGADLPSWLWPEYGNIASTGVMTLLVSPSASLGPVVVRLTATDSGGAQRSVDFTLTVVNDTTPELNGTAAPITVIAGQPLSLELLASTYFRDADAGDRLTLSLDSISPSAPWLSLDTTTPGALRLRGTPTTANTYTLTLRATDSSGQSVIRTLTLQVQSNAAPVPKTVPAQTAVLNRAFAFQRTLDQLFTDTNGDALGITAKLADGSALPSWLNLQVLNDTNPPTVRLTGWVPPGLSPQTLSVVLTARDPLGASANTTVTVNVIANPGPTVIATPPTQSATVIQPQPYSATFRIADYFRDDQGDPFGISLVSSSKSSWLTMTVNYQAGTFTLAGTPVDNSTQSGQYAVQVLARDCEGGESTLTINFDVRTQYPPVIESVSNVSLITGAPFNVRPVVATDPDDITLNYTAEIKTRDDGSVSWDASMLPGWLHFDSGSGQFYGTAPTTTFSDTFRVGVSDGHNVRVYRTFTISVNENQVVQLTSTIPSATVALGSVWTYTVPSGTFTDPETQTLTYSASGLPAGLNFDPQTRQFTGAPTAAGTYSITVTATDPSGSYALTSFLLKVNAAPTVAVQIPNQTAIANGAQWTYTFPANTFADANFPNETLTYTATGMPSWMSFNDTTRTFQGTPSTIGSWPIQVTARDESGATVITSFNVATPNAAPYIALAITDRSTVVNQSWNWAIPAGTFRDYNNPSQTFSYTVGALPPGVSFSGSTFSGTPTVPGVYTINVTASDGSLSVTDSFLLTVTNNPPTVQNPIPDMSTPGHQAWSYTFPANTFNDVNGQTLTYTASGLPTGLSFNGSTISGTPTQLGTFTVTITAKDGYDTVSDSFLLTITNAAPVYNGGLTDKLVNLGSAVNWTWPAGMFTDVNQQTLTYSAQVERPAYTYTTWVNGEPHDHDVAAQWVDFPTAGMSINSSNGQITGTPTSITAGSTIYSYRIKVIASDGSSFQPLTGEGIFRLTLNRPPVRNVTFPDKTIPRGAAWNYTPMAGSFSDPENLALSYTATGLPPGVIMSAGGTFSGTPTAEGTYTVTITATDSGGLTASGSFTITVDNRAPQQTGGLIANQSTMLGQPCSFSFPANIFTDPNLDTVSYTASGMPPGITFAPGTCTFSGTPTATGTYTVTVTASDGRLSASTTFGISVANSNAPAVAFLISDLNVETGTAYTKIIPSNTFNGTNLTWTVARTDGLAFPAWMVWDSTQHKFSGTPTGTVNANFDVRVTVRDDQNRTAFDDFHVFKLGSGGSGGGAKLMADSGSAKTNNGNASSSKESNRDKKASSSLASYTTTDMSAMSSPAEEVLAYDLAVAPVSLATAFNTSGALQMSWFTYDEENRTVVHQGQLVNGQVTSVPGGYIQRYDAVGNAVLKLTQQIGEKFQYLRSTYDLRGQLIGVGTPMSAGQPEGNTLELRSYDDSGRVKEIRRFYRQGYFLQGKDVSGLLESAEIYWYDPDGRVREVINRARSRDTESNGTLKWLNALDLSDPNVRSAQASNVGLLFQASSTRYYTNSALEDLFGPGLYGYDYQGNLKGYQFEVYKDGENSLGYVHSYTYTYQKGEQYLEKTVSGTSSDSQFKPTSVTSYYDSYGRRLGVEEYSPKAIGEHTLKLFSYNADGQILTRRDGTFDADGKWYQAARATYGREPNAPVDYVDNPIPERISEATWYALSLDRRKEILLKEQNQRYVYANGQLVAQGSQAGNLNVLESLTGYGDAGASRSQIAVQAGDTLRGIATRVYGNGDLWYVIADANGMVSDQDLVAGTLLTVPSVKVSSNDATTFKPYDPGAIVGSTTPDMPFIAKPPSSGCSGIAMLLRIVVMVVVTVFAPYLTWYAAAAIGAVGEYTAQSVEIHQGYREDYDYGAVAVAGASAGVAGGGGLGELSTGYAVADAAIMAAASYVASYAVNKALHEDVHFSMRQMFGQAASAAVATAISTGGLKTPAATGEASGGMVGRTVGANVNWRAVAVSVVQATITGTASKVVGNFVGSAIAGGKPRLDVPSAFVDAFGNAVASASLGIKQGAFDEVGESGIGPVERQSLEKTDAHVAVDDVVYPLDGTLPAPTEGRTFTTSRPVRTSAVRAHLDSSNGVGSSADGVTTLETVTVTAPRDLTMDDLMGARMLIASSPRHRVDKGVRLFDRDSINEKLATFTPGIYGGGWTQSQFEEREELRKKLRLAESSIKGDAQLIAVYGDGMSSYDKLINALRVGGGYFDAAVGQNLLDQINSGADAVDLTHVRGQSEGVMSALRSTGEYNSDLMSRASGAIFAKTGEIPASAYDQVDSLYRASNPLLPPRLIITESGIRRNVSEAINRALLDGMAADLAVLPLALMRGATVSVVADNAINVPNLTERGTLLNLRPQDVAIAQRPVRTLVQDGSGRYWLQSPGGNRITPSGSYDFVTLPDGTVRVARPNVNPDFSTHLGLSGGGEVNYAGSIRFGNNMGPNRGSIIQWTNNSGHYQPPAYLRNNAGLPDYLFRSH